jgi:hypothetical protein
MGEINIRFRMNMKTGKKDIYIDFESDEDAMRHEHEREHKKIIERLVGAGLLEDSEVGEVIVERQQPGLLNENKEPPAAEPEAQAQGSGG